MQIDQVMGCFEERLLTLENGACKSLRPTSPCSNTPCSTVLEAASVFDRLSAVLSTVMGGVLGVVDSRREMQRQCFRIDWTSAVEVSSPFPAS